MDAAERLAADEPLGPTGPQLGGGIHILPAARLALDAFTKGHATGNSPDGSFGPYATPT